MGLLASPQSIKPVEIKQAASAGFLILAFLASLFFYSTAQNLVVLLFVAMCLVLALSIVGLKKLAQLIAVDRASWVAVGALVYLCVCYRWSLSPDSSFAPSWVLAALPLSFLLMRSYSRGVQQLVGATIGLAIIGFAFSSVVRLFLFGERAHLPLADPNNYATLMYLCWIPLVQNSFVRVWLDTDNAWYRDRRFWLILLPGFLLLMANFATSSRTATLVVAVCFAFWLLLALVKRYPIGPIIIHALVAIISLQLINRLGTSGMQELVAGSSLSEAITERFAIIQSAWEMRTHGPILGIGIFCFPLLYPGYRSYLDQDTAGFFVHNDYVQLFVEGGFPLLLLLCVLVVGVGLHLLKLLRDGPEQLVRVGAALAFCAAAAHANLNFVFYNLSLVICLSVIVVLSLDAPITSPTAPDLVASKKSKGIYAGIGAGLVFGWVCLAYLFLDTMIYGVFQGQKGLGLAQSIRSDPQRARAFAKLAHQLNGNRGIPLLAEALYTANDFSLEPDSEFLKERSVTKFRQALQVDPWNPRVYLEFANFIGAHNNKDLKLYEGENFHELNFGALSLNPLYVLAIENLLSEFSREGQTDKRYVFLRRLVYPWIVVLKRRDPMAVDRYMDELIKTASRDGDMEFVEALRQQLLELEKIQPLERQYWLLPD